MGIADYIGTRLFGNAIFRTPARPAQRTRSTSETLMTASTAAASTIQNISTNNTASAAILAESVAAAPDLSNVIDLTQDDDPPPTQAAGQKRTHANISDATPAELSKPQSPPGDRLAIVDTSAPTSRINWRATKPPKSDPEAYRKWKKDRRHGRGRLWERLTEEEREDHTRRKRRRKEAEKGTVDDETVEEAPQIAEQMRAEEAEAPAAIMQQPPTVPRLVEVLGVVLDLDEMDTDVPDDTDNAHTMEEDCEDLTAAEMAPRIKAANNAKIRKAALASHASQAAEAAKAKDVGDLDVPHWSVDDYEQAVRRSQQLVKDNATGKVNVHAVQQQPTPPSSSDVTALQQPRYVKLQQPPVAKSKPPPQGPRSQPIRSQLAASKHVSSQPATSQPATSQPATSQPGSSQSVLSHKSVPHSAFRFRTTQPAQCSKPQISRKRQEQGAVQLAELFNTIVSSANTLPTPRSSNSPPVSQEDWVPTSAQPNVEQTSASSAAPAPAVVEARTQQPSPPAGESSSAAPHPAIDKAPIASVALARNAVEARIQQPPAQPATIAPIFAQQSTKPASVRSIASQPTAKTTPGPTVAAPSASAPELRQQLQSTNYDAYLSLTRQGQVKRKAAEDRAKREELERKQAEKRLKEAAAARNREQRSNGYRGPSSSHWHHRNTAAHRSHRPTAVQLARQSATALQSSRNTSTGSAPYISLAAGMPDRNQRQATPTAPLAMRNAALHKRVWHGLDQRDQLRQRAEEASRRRVVPPVAPRRPDRPSSQIFPSQYRSSHGRRGW